MEKIILISEISNKIKKELKKQNLTYFDIANEINCSYCLISQIINGKIPLNSEFYNFIIKKFPDLLNLDYIIFKYKRLSKIEILLNGTKISWYWIGFLLADGHFSKNGISLSLPNKDINQLEKFIEYINYRGKIEKKNHKTPFGHSCYSKISFNGKKETQKLMEILHLKNTNKTNNPPKYLPNISREKIVSMFVGFIDGGGSISKRKRGDITIEIEIHSSWKEYIHYLISMIYECCGEIYYNKIETLSKTVKFHISNPIVMKFLNNKIKEYSLPILQRKWNNIEYVNSSKFEEQRRREKLFPILIEQGYSLKDLADFFNMHKSNVCRTIKRLRLISPSKK